MCKKKLTLIQLLQILICKLKPEHMEGHFLMPIQPQKLVVQVEMGYLFARDGGVDRYEVPGTLVRVGLGARTELRVGHAGVVEWSGS